MWLLLDQPNVDWMCSVTYCLLSLWPWWDQRTLQNFSYPLSNEDTGSFWPHGCKGRLQGCEELGHCATVMRTRQEKNFSSSNERKILSSIHIWKDVQNISQLPMPSVSLHKQWWQSKLKLSTRCHQSLAWNSWTWEKTYYSTCAGEEQSWTAFVMEYT